MRRYLLTKIPGSTVQNKIIQTKTKYLIHNFSGKTMLLYLLLFIESNLTFLQGQLLNSVPFLTGFTEFSATTIP
jgi:hypothetical protein